MVREDRSRGGVALWVGLGERVDFRQWIKEETSSITNYILKCFSWLFKKF